MRILILALAAASAFGQTTYYNRTYKALYEASLSGAASTVTVQQPASGARTVYIKSVYVYCSVACTFTLERNGTAASSTSLTPVSMSANNPTVAATAWRTSNVGAGTTISPTYRVGAGDYEFLAFTLGDMVLAGTGTTKNFTVRTNSITGTAEIEIVWEEQ